MKDEKTMNPAGCFNCRHNAKGQTAFEPGKWYKIACTKFPKGLSDACMHEEDFRYDVPECHEAVN